MATEMENSLARLCDRQMEKIAELSRLNQVLFDALRQIESLAVKDYGDVARQEGGLK